MQEESITELLKRQRDFYRAGKTVALDFRRAALEALDAALVRWESELYEALWRDLGKSKTESYATELGFVRAEIRHTLRHLRRWAASRRVRTPMMLFPARGRILQEPYGVALIIGPFNYPVQLLLEPLVGAIAAGNCAVLKASELTPHVA